MPFDVMTGGRHAALSWPAPVLLTLTMILSGCAAGWSAAAPVTTASTGSVLRTAAASLTLTSAPAGMTECYQRPAGPAYLLCWHAAGSPITVAPIVVKTLSGQGLGRTKGLCKAAKAPEPAMCVYLGTYQSVVLHVLVEPDTATQGSRITLSLLPTPLPNRFGDPTTWPLVSS
jgi:hypothetical protein